MATDGERAVKMNNRPVMKRSRDTANGMRDTRKSSTEMKERKCNGLSSKTLASQEKEPRKPRKNANAAIKYFFPKIDEFPE